MNNDMIKQYNLSIKSLKQSIADKKSTLYCLVAKYQPDGMWDHGEELLEVEAQIEELETQEIEKGRLLKTAREEALGVRPTIDTTPKLF
jgi:hypothetical protein